MSINHYLSSTEKNICERVRIGIAGTGGLGSNVATHLVRAGITNLVLIDDDLVNASNLNRQFFFATQIGQEKILALRDNLLAINNELSLTLHCEKLTAKNIQQIFADCDLVIECLDNIDDKKMLVEEMSSVNKTIIAASGIGGWGNSEAITLKKIGRNLYCIGDGVSDTQTKNPQSPRVGMVAAMQANTAISLILSEKI